MNENEKYNRIKLPFSAPPPHLELQDTREVALIYISSTSFSYYHNLGCFIRGVQNRKLSIRFCASSSHSREENSDLCAY